ncbi:MAG: hypothetical protein ACRENG_02925 [bacterium]
MLSTDDKKPGLPSDGNSCEVPHMILIAEFEYLANAAQQANEDRAKVVQYYFMVLGALAGSVVGLREIPPTYLQWAYGVLTLIFLVLTVFGVFTVRQLIGLRLAWLEYSLAMDKIKEYYIDRFSNAGLPAAIRLRANKLPLAYQSGTISHLLALTIFLINALSLIIASTFLQLTLFKCLKFGAVMISGSLLAVLLVGGQQLYYRMKLEKSGIQKDIFDEIENIKKKEGQADV